MVTATTAQVVFRDLVTNEKYAVSAYISDVAAALWTWSKQGAAVAGSSNVIQFKNAVVVDDISIIAGPTVISGWYWLSAQTPIANTNNLIAPNYTTILVRNFTRTGFAAGQLIQAIQF